MLRRIHLPRSGLTQREVPLKDLGGHDIQVMETLAGPVVTMSPQVLEGKARSPVFKCIV